MILNNSSGNIIILEHFLTKISHQADFEDWKQILYKIDGNNVIYGFGAQGDRYLINQSASNAFIYAYASSGIIGLSILILFLIMMCIPNN